MATRHELNKQRQYEFIVARDAWHDLFMKGLDESDQEALLVAHMDHPSPGLAAMIDSALEEGIEEVNRALKAYEEKEGFDSPDEAFNAALNGYARMARFVAYRMFIIGQHVAGRVLWTNLAPCEHVAVPDDELETFLRTAADTREGGEK